MKRTLAGLVVVLTAASAAAVDPNLFYLEVANSDPCMGVKLTVGAQTYELKSTTGKQLFGPTPEALYQDRSMPTTFMWYAYTYPNGNGCQNTHAICSGQFALTEGSGTVCRSTAEPNRGLLYRVTTVTEGGHVYWWITLTPD